MHLLYRNFPLVIFSLCSALLLLGGCYYHKSRTKGFPGKFWIYNHSENGGLLRGDVKHGRFSVAERKDTVYVPDIARLNKVIKWAKVKKSMPAGKLGAETEYLFCGAQIGNRYHRILICNDDMMIDFTDNKDYLVADRNDKAWLAALHRMK